MAGKLHKIYASYLAGGGRTVAPGDRRGRAYAEGYQARRKTLLRTANPHPQLNDNAITSAYGAWDQGWIDADVFAPATHVGKPDNTV